MLFWLTFIFSQLIVLQNAVAMYSEMMNMEIYNADEVCQFTVDILESINTKQLSPKLLLAKLNCIIDTVRSPLFQNMSKFNYLFLLHIDHDNQHFQLLFSLVEVTFLW